MSPSTSSKSKPPTHSQPTSQSQILTVTIQAALFSALSTTLAQAITAYQSQTSSQTHQQPLWKTFDPLPLLTFMAIAIIMTPPNYIYQRFLEDTFPSKVPVSKPLKDKPEPGSRADERLSKSNTLAKFCLDQSLGAMANTAGFIVLAGLAKGRGVGMVLGHDLQRDFLPMLTASWRVWPTVTLLNLIVVPFDYRMIVGNLVGVCWGVYVTMQTM